MELISYFHTSATALFEGLKAKIEAGEPPYVDTRDPESPDDEPAFFEEWEKANEAVTITGAACLDLLQSTLHGFLDEYMRQIGNEHVIPQLKELKQKSWFGNYKLFFREELEIDWETSGADLALFEQVILAATISRIMLISSAWTPSRRDFTPRSIRSPHSPIPSTRPCLWIPA